MLAALQTTGMYYFGGICIKRTKPHFSTPFFVSVWNKGLIVQFEQKKPRYRQKAKISDIKLRYRTKSRDIGPKAEISEKIQIVLLSSAIFIAI